MSEVVVTGPGAPPITTLDDLAGQEVFVREQSLYGESLAKLNEQLKARGKPAVVITPLPIVLEDDDILEMVNAGLVPITITDDYLAQFWKKVFTGLTVHADVSVRTGGELAIAVRKENHGCWQPSIRGSESTARGMRSETRSSAAISTT